MLKNLEKIKNCFNIYHMKKYLCLFLFILSINAFSQSNKADYFSANLLSLPIDNPVFKINKGIHWNANKIQLLTDNTIDSNETAEEDESKKKKKRDKEKDETKKDWFKPQNPFQNLETGWVKEQNRLEKIFIAVGGASFAVGSTMMIIGFINYFVPFVDQSTIGNKFYIALIGIGGGLIANGFPFTLVGGIRLRIKKKKAANPEVSLSFFLI